MMRTDGESLPFLHQHPPFGLYRPVTSIRISPTHSFISASCPTQSPTLPDIIANTVRESDSETDKNIPIMHYGQSLYGTTTRNEHGQCFIHDYMALPNTTRSFHRQDQVSSLVNVYNIYYIEQNYILIRIFTQSFLIPISLRHPHAAAALPSANYKRSSPISTLALPAFKNPNHS